MGDDRGRDGVRSLLFPRSLVVARTLVARGRIAIEHPDMIENDVNPLIPSDHGAVAVAGLVVVDRGGRT